MRIWLAKVGEPLPFDGPNTRLLRTGQLAEWLANRGDEVVFFTGTMNHTARSLRAEQTTEVDLSPNYKIVMLKGRVYKRSRSFARHMNHKDVARSFAAIAPRLPPPDVILTAFPTIELCRAVADYAEPRSIPFIVDARDFWPDLFVELLPKPIQFLAPIVFANAQTQTENVFGRATAVSGMTESAMQWALNKAGRAKGKFDFWYPFTYPTTPERTDDSPADLAALKLTSLPREDVKFCFFGTHSHRVNLEMFVETFRLMEQRGARASVIICGDGEVHNKLQEIAAGSKKVFFPGWLNAAQIRQVMALSDIGILPYNRPDFFMSCPNKVAEYFAGGLPILSCTHGEVKKLLESQECGFWCQPDTAAIADKITEIIDNPDRLSHARKQATRVFAELFDQDQVFSTLRARLSQLLLLKDGTKHRAA